jgi:hypothetical protein
MGLTPAGLTCEAVSIQVDKGVTVWVGELAIDRSIKRGICTTGNMNDRSRKIVSD